MKIPRAVRRCGALAGVSALAVLTVLVVLEVVLRIAAPGENTTHWERDPIVGWRGRRSQVGTIRAKVTFTEYAHNADGFRDDDRSVEKADVAERILCVGDSFTWGWGVPRDAVYTRRLERLIEREGPPVEVVNHGVGGHNTVQSLVLLTDRGFALDPDTVVYQATGNDIPTNRYGAPAGSQWEHPYAELREDGEVVIRGTPTHPLTPVDWIKYQLPRHSRLAYVVRMRVGRLQARFARRGAEDRPAPEAAGDPGVDEDFRLFAALVRRMERECAARGVRFVLLADFAMGPERSDYWRTACAGIEAHFIREHLLGREEESGLEAYIPRDGHWTEDGHAWVAEYLADVIRQ
jgi:hypothetical protein